MSQVKQVKDSINIVDVIGQRLELKNAGINYKGLCPFHGERTPSFFVNEQLQRYRCFGCGASGDVFNFLEEYEGMTFVEALEYLAQEAGIKLEQYQRSSLDDEHDRLLEILELAAQYYHYLLTKHSVGKKAKDYLKNRRFSNESIKLFKLGYAVNSWDGLLKFLHFKKKFSKEDILKTGLVIRNQTGRYYDRFRGRVMFPLRNHRGQVVGFSGRVLQKDAKEAKYLNTPETSLYHKSKMLFGYSELFSEIKKKQAVIVCEGEADVILSSQNHVNHIVAIKGSALTQDQIKLFSRVAKKVILALDTDNAGIKASQRAIKLMAETNLDLRVIDVNYQAKEHALEAGLSKKELEQLPKFKDIGELIEYNGALWREVSKHTESVFDFLIRISAAKHDIKTIEGKTEILEDLAEPIADIAHAVEQDFYIKKIAKLIDVKPEFVRSDLIKIANKNKLNFETKAKPKTEEDQNLPHQQKLEQYLLFLSFHLKDKALLSKLDQLLELSWQITAAKLIFEKLTQQKSKYDFKKLADSLDEDLKALLMDWYLSPKYFVSLEDLDLEAEWQNTYEQLQKIQLKEQIKVLSKEIAQLDKIANKSSPQEEKLENLLLKLSAFHARLKNL